MPHTDPTHPDTIHLKSSGAGKLKITITNQDNTTVEDEADVTVNALPPSPTIHIDTQPSNATTNEGSATTFTVAASVLNPSGTHNLAYQWKKDGSNVAADATHSGVTTATLTISNTSITDAGSYTVDVKSTGLTTVTSTPATLSVTPETFTLKLINVNTQLELPKVGQDYSLDLLNGSSQGITVQKIGSFQGAISGGGNNFSRTGGNATIATVDGNGVPSGHTATATAVSSGTTTYTLSSSDNKASATLKINVTTPPTFVTHPTSPTTATTGASYTTNAVSATGDATIGYQWQSVSGASGGTFANITGATGTTLTVASPVTGTMRYRVIATNGAGTATSNVLTVVTTAPPPTPVSVVISDPASNLNASILGGFTTKQCVATVTMSDGSTVTGTAANALVNWTCTNNLTLGGTPTINSSGLYSRNGALATVVSTIKAALKVDASKFDDVQILIIA